MPWLLKFTHPWILYTMLGVSVVALFLQWRLRRMVIYRYPLATELSRHGLVTQVPRAQILAGMRWLLLVVFALLLARPQWIDQRSCREVEGIDIVVALDVSGSMSHPHCQDDRRPRIDVAKQEALRFINKRTHDALGLVLFGDDAISRCPLTSDKHMLLDSVAQVELGIVPHEGTVITKALLTAINRLRYSKAKSKIIILLTDGEPTENDADPRIAIQAAQQLGIKIYTIGIGDTQDIMMRHPLYGMIPIVHRVNTQLLTLFAQETGGLFFMAKHPDDMRRIYDTIDSLEKTRIEVPLFSRCYDWFLPLVWCALILIIIEVYLTSCLWFGL